MSNEPKFEKPFEKKPSVIQLRADAMRDYNIQAGAEYTVKTFLEGDRYSPYVSCTLPDGQTCKFLLQPTYQEGSVVTFLESEPTRSS